MKNNKIETIDDFAKVAEAMLERSGLGAAVDAAVRNDLDRLFKQAADPVLQESDFPAVPKVSPPSADAAAVKVPPGLAGKAWDAFRSQPWWMQGGEAIAAHGGATELARAAGGMPTAGILKNVAYGVPKRVIGGIADIGAKGVRAGVGSDFMKGMLRQPVKLTPGGVSGGARAGAALRGFTTGTVAPLAAAVGTGLAAGSYGGAALTGYKPKDVHEAWGGLLGVGGNAEKTMESAVAGFGLAPSGPDIESFKGTDLRAAQQHRVERQATSAGMKPEDWLRRHQDDFRAKKGLPALPADRELSLFARPGGTAAKPAETKPPEKTPEEKKLDWKPSDKPIEPVKTTEHFTPPSS